MKIVIYPGKFQPFSRHHYAAYMHLKQQFPDAIVFVVSSNKRTNDCQFTFDDKQLIAAEFGINPKHFLYEKNPYSPEFINHYDLSDVILICAYSDKDSGRLATTKKDGTPGYYQHFPTDGNFETSDKHGYIYQIPKINIMHNGNILSGTYVRNVMKYGSPTDFNEIFGWFKKSIYDMVKDRLMTSSLDEIINGTPPKKLINNILAEKLIHTRSVMGIDRNDMPQIDDINALMEWLAANNINFDFVHLPLKKIKLTQTLIDSDKIETTVILKTPLLISNEFHLLDGHHRLLGAIKCGIITANFLKINLSTLEAINKLKEYNKTNFKTN